MPWKVARTDQCPAGEPYGVMLASTGKVIKGGCHDTEKAAQAHKRALYANAEATATATVLVRRRVDPHALAVVVSRFLEVERATRRRRTLAPYEVRATRQLQRLFKTQREVFLSRLAPLAPQFDAPGKAIPGWEPAWNEAKLATFQGFAKVIGGLHRDAMAAGADDIRHNAVPGRVREAAAPRGEVGISFDINDPRAVAWLAANGGTQITRIDDTTQAQITQLIRDGMDNGLSYKDLSANIRDRFDGFAGGLPGGGTLGSQFENRAELIAVQEAANAYSFGQLQAASDLQDGGIPMVKSWLTAEDDAVDEDCQMNADDGQIPLDDSFSSGDDAPPAHVNCRCDLVVEPDPEFTGVERPEVSSPDEMPPVEEVPVPDLPEATPEELLTPDGLPMPDWAQEVQSLLTNGVDNEVQARQLGDAMVNEIDRRAADSELGQTIAAHDASAQKLALEADERIAERSSLMAERVDINDRVFGIEANQLSAEEKASLFARKEEIEAELIRLNERLAWLDEKGDIQIELRRAAERKLDAERSRVARDVLGEVRAMNTADIAQTQAFGDAGPVSALNKAAEEYPAAWVAESLSASGFDLSVSVDPSITARGLGGYYHPLEKKIVSANLDYDTMVHELAHRFEDVMPQIAKLEGEFWDRRTAGEVTSQLQGHSIGTTGRPDDFFSSYVGRDGRADYGGRFWEILSRGTESMFGDGTYRGAIWADRDYATFVLGVLAGV